MTDGLTPNELPYPEVVSRVEPADPALHFPKLTLEEIGSDMPISIKFDQLHSLAGEKMMQYMLIYANRGMNMRLTVEQPPKGGWPLSMVEKYRNGV